MARDVHGILSTLPDFFYQGIQEEDAHFSDQGVLLYDTLDASAYGLSMEQMKIAFRMLYSLLDKIAFFINFYWKVGEDPDKVSLRSIWYEKASNKNKQKSIRKVFYDYENLPLRGLFWLACDIVDTKSDLYETLEPDAYEINAIRNYLEHKYLKVHHPSPEGNSSPFRNNLAYSITQNDFSAKTLRLFKLVRAGLIYLSLAVHREEQIRQEEISNDIILPIKLMPIEKQ